MITRRAAVSELQQWVCCVGFMFWTAGCGRTGDAMQDGQPVARQAGDTLVVQWATAAEPGQRPRDRLIGLDTLIDSDNLEAAHAAALLPDGQIVVADGASLLLWTSEAGVLGIGGRGDGPGEFRRIDGVTAAKDGTIAVWDAALRRLSWFSSMGQFLRSGSLSNLPGYGSPLRVGIGLVGDRLTLAAGAELVAADGRRDSVVVMAIEVGTGVATRLEIVPNIGWTHYGQVLGPADMFGPRAIVAVGANGHVAWADGVSACATVRRPLSVPRYLKSCHTFVLTKVRDLQQPSDSMLEELGARGTMMREMMTQAEKGAPEHVPVIYDLRLERDGSLWIQASSQTVRYAPMWQQILRSARPSSYLWLRVSPSGAVTGVREVPSDVEPLVFEGANAVALQRNEDGTASLVRVRWQSAAAQ